MLIKLVRVLQVIVDLLLTDRDTEKVNELLDRMNRIFQDILMKFFMAKMDFGLPEMKHQYLEVFKQQQHQMGQTDLQLTVMIFLTYLVPRQIKNKQMSHIFIIKYLFKTLETL